MELDQAVAVVTGAARGLGRVIAESLAGQGMAVAMVDVLADPLNEAAAALRDRGGRAIALPCDITSAKEVAAVAEKVAAELGPPAVVVTSAGSLSAIGPVWDVDPGRWCRDATVNLCGVFLVCRHMLGAMIDRGDGYVINLVGAGTDNTHPYTTAYDASKAAVMRFTEGLAHEAAAHGVKAFCLYPGTVRTAMTEFILNSDEGRRYRPRFEAIFAESRDHGPDRAAMCVKDILSGRLDGLSGRWIDATKDLDGLIADRESVEADNLYVLRLRRG